MSDIVIGKETTTDQSAVLIETDGNNLVVVVNVESGAGSLVATITGETSSGYSYPILTSASISGVGVTALRVFPGATPAANLVANDVVPKTVKLAVDVTGTISYGIDAFSED